MQQLRRNGPPMPRLGHLPPSNKHTIEHRAEQWHIAGGIRAALYSPGIYAGRSLIRGWGQEPCILSGGVRQHICGRSI
jgi:hypothetical protein